MKYVSKNDQLPEEGQTVLCAMTLIQPMVTRKAIFREGKFWDMEDSLELFPVYWSAVDNNNK